MQQGFRGAIFDVDGVLVDSPHEAAWRDAFTELMESDWADIRDQTSWTPDAFTAEVYQQVLSGKPRMEGAMAALKHFGVPEPETRVDAYAERKQEMVVELIKAGQVLRLPRRAALPARRQGRRDRRRRGVVLEERRPLPAPDPPGRVRRAGGPGVRLDRARA